MTVGNCNNKAITDMGIINDVYLNWKPDSPEGKTTHTSVLCEEMVIVNFV